MVDSLYRQIGGVKLPAEASALDSEVSFDTLDPAKRRLLALLVAAINAELGGAWTTVAAMTALAGTSPVEDAYPYRPDSQRAQERKTGWPTLYLHRQGRAQYEEHTTVLQRKTQQWQVHYVFGPLQVGDVAKLEGALWIAADVVAAVLELGYHPAYESGAMQFGQDEAGISQARLVGAEVGEAQFAANSEITYYACLMELETQEIGRFRDGIATPYDGSASRRYPDRYGRHDRGGLMGPISLPQVRIKDRTFVRQVNKIVGETVKQGAEAGKQRVYQSPGFRPRTGALQKATHYKIIRLRHGRRVIFSNRLPYAASIDQGARKHEIWPKEGYGLVGPLRSSQGRREITDIGTYRTALMWFVGGKPIWRRMVKHPGNRPYKFLYKANYAAYRVTGRELRLRLGKLKF